MILVIGTILWILYASLEGEREARHFFYRAGSSRQDTYNEHTGFAIQRIAAWVPYEYVLFDPSNYLTALNGIFLAFMFIMIHDGMYFRSYHNLAGNYPLGFWSFPSEHSNSRMDRLGLTDPILRITYFVIGVIGLIIINYAKY